MRACIIPSNACLILSAGIDPVSSCSSMTVSSCRSRAAHPRVKEPAVAACVIMPMTNVASIHGIRRWGEILGMANLLDASGQSKFHRAKSKLWWPTSGGPAGQPAATCDGLPSLDAGVTREHGADGRIGIRADVFAVDEHVVRRVAAVLLGPSKRA